MKSIDDILLLGHPLLYERSAPVLASELPQVAGWVADMHQVMEEIRAKYQFGRGIAAPQLGIMKRLIYLNVDQPRVLINPVLHDLSAEQFDVWDDCMSFPHLWVRVRRHQRLTVSYRDAHWQEQVWQVEGDLSELIQHEYDHLEGILCTMRAIDDKSFRWRP